jgi:menaquinol-cytochrome c reductase iron-sulfur subunit
MTEPTTSITNTKQNGRRSILLFIPAALFTAIACTVASAAFRFLRPFAASAKDQQWTNVAPVTQLTGDKPLMKTIFVERTEGWATTREQHLVYVTPDKKVLSAVCPHESCDVAWRDDNNQFLCPCHNSLFAKDGTRISGPSQRGLDPLPTRVQDGNLQVQYLSFVNNKADRLVRG